MRFGKRISYRLGDWCGKSSCDGSLDETTRIRISAIVFHEASDGIYIGFNGRAFKKTTLDADRDQLRRALPRTIMPF